MRETPCIRIGHLKIADHLILGIARLQMEKNQTGPDPSGFETIAMNSWNQVCDALTQGDINGAFMTIPMAIHLFAQGLDISVLMFTHRSGSVIVQNKAAGIHHMDDFKGRTVLVPSLLSMQALLVHRLLAAAGLQLGAHDSRTADVVCEVASPCLMAQMLAADQDGDIAAIAVPEPFGRQAVHQGLATELCSSKKLWPDHPCCAFVVQTAFIDHHREAIRQMVALFAQTGQAIETDKTDAILDVACSFLGQKKSIVQHVLLETGLCFDPVCLIPDLDALDAIQTYMTDKMRILAHKIDMNRLVDPWFILNAISEKNP